MGAGAVLAPYGGQAPLQAQEADEPGTEVGIRLSDLVDRITYTIVDRFEVKLTNLTASEAYEVIVSSDTAALGIDSCGTTSQTQLVTGTASHAFKVIVYACAVDGGTVTAEVRRSGSSTAEASASQGLTVLPIPDYVPAEERPARGATRNVARVGTPGIVQNVQVAERGPTSFKITWSPPAGNGGEPLTGYGLLIWHEDTTQPPYDQAASIGVTDNHTFTGLQPSNTYNFRIHACNGTDSWRVVDGYPRGDHDGGHAGSWRAHGAAFDPLRPDRLQLVPGALEPACGDRGLRTHGLRHSGAAERVELGREPDGMGRRGSAASLQRDRP